MYKNYGDRNFFEYGVLVDSEHSDTEFSIIYCRPYDDEENQYQFAHVYVDITDSWIDKEVIASYIGEEYGEKDLLDMDIDKKIKFAIGAIEYYGLDEFSPELHDADWRNVDREYIEKYLDMQLIASDDLDMPWKDDRSPWQWECTDIDSLQYGKKIADDEWNYVQFDETPEGFGIVRQEVIKLSGFSPEEIESYVTPFYRGGVETAKKEYPDDWKQIVCECIFEMEPLDRADSSTEAQNYEDAEKIIKNFIWNRKEVVW